MDLNNGQLRKLKMKLEAGPIEWLAVILEFQKIGPFLYCGVPIVRIMAAWGLYWSPLFFLETDIYRLQGTLNPKTPPPKGSWFETAISRLGSRTYRVRPFLQPTHTTPLLYPKLL